MYTFLSHENVMTELKLLWQILNSFDRISNPCIAAV